jgi:hypothetical protein
VPVETVATIQAPTAEAAARIADQQDGQHVMWGKPIERHVSPRE